MILLGKMPLQRIGYYFEVAFLMGKYTVKILGEASKFNRKGIGNEAFGD